MPRRKSDDSFTILRNIFMITPWWVCPLTAGVVYVALGHLLPAVFRPSILTRGLGQVSAILAPWLAIGILLIGVSAAMRRKGSAALLDSQLSADTISSLTWQEFEQLLAAAYRRQGYRVVETGGGGPDGGVDLVLHGNGETVLVQCKQWRSYRVGVRELREFHGILHSKGASADRGVFVTFGEYTQEALRFAQENHLELVDRGKLVRMIEQSQRVTTSARVPPQPIATSRLDRAATARTDERASGPICPRCGSPMILKTARRGTNSGSQFWGCSSFPKCRHTAEHRPS